MLVLQDSKILYRRLKKGAAQLMQNPGTNSHSKLIVVRHHFVRERVHRRGLHNSTGSLRISTCRYFDQGFSIGDVCVSLKIPNELEVIFCGRIGSLVRRVRIVYD